MSEGLTFQEHDRIMEDARYKASNVLNFAGLITTISILTCVSQCGRNYSLKEQLEQMNPTNARIEYVNKDTLPDLVFKTGEIYLQSKDGKLVSYDTIMRQEKMKVDSIYQAKQDSVKNVYMNK